jgi:hypothetical protein
VGLRLGLLLGRVRSGSTMHFIVDRQKPRERG